MGKWRSDLGLAMCLAAVTYCAATGNGWVPAALYVACEIVFWMVG